MPGNPRRGRPQGKRHREQTAAAPATGGAARVKRWGKSPPRPRQRGRHGKPHREQGQIGEARVRPGAVSGPLPGWTARGRGRPRSQMNGHPCRALGRGGTEPGLQAVRTYRPGARIHPRLTTLAYHAPAWGAAGERRPFPVHGRTRRSGAWHTGAPHRSARGRRGRPAVLLSRDPDRSAPWRRIPGHARTGGRRLPERSGTPRSLTARDPPTIGHPETGRAARRRVRPPSIPAWPARRAPARGRRHAPPTLAPPALRCAPAPSASPALENCQTQPQRRHGLPTA